VYNKAAILTGSSGAIGSAIVDVLQKNKFFVVGVDVKPPDLSMPNEFIEVDLSELIANEALRDSFIARVHSVLVGHNLEVIIHSAAIQVFDDNSMDDVVMFLKSQSINAASSLLLYRGFSDLLCLNRGTFLNVGSIHSSLTKPGFLSYAASKASLRSLTRSLAMESEGRVRVLSIEPAAIDTEMLSSGFDDKEKLEQLKSYHPVKDIGTTRELAEFIHLLVQSEARFLHGSAIDFSGGIASRLHDPD
jgi:NAD(P)-dependent dehydrogenase (short-subunit alcohol dehydrogenase family)